MAPNQNPLGVSTITRQCNRKHCTAFAAFLPIIRVRAKGTPDAEPLAVRVQLSLCEDCMRSVQVGEFLSPRMRKAITATCAKTYGKQPDFRGAYLEKEPLAEDV